jgi:L-asparaginase
MHLQTSFKMLLMKLENNKKIIILGTGGTIAGKSAVATDNVGYVASQVGIEQILAAIPSLISKSGKADGKAEYAGCELICEQVSQIDSKDMNVAVWRRLLARCQHWLAQADVQGVVITHGTDTLEETAFFLHATLQAHQPLAKPVVLTCAMRPTTAIAPDGPQNLMDALAVASCGGAQPGITGGISGVVAVCAGVIHSAVNVQKVHNYRLDAFSSGDAGALGYVREGKVVIYRKYEGNIALSDVLYGLLAIDNIAEDSHDLPRVEIVVNHSGATGAMVEALLAQRKTASTTATASTHKLAGIVVAATGNGTISKALEAALQTAEADGVVVWRSTRCAFGVLVGKANAQFGDSGGLSPVKARVALMLHLSAKDLPTNT